MPSLRESSDFSEEEAQQRRKEAILCTKKQKILLPFSILSQEGMKE
jgi:hypothetical protein